METEPNSANLRAVIAFAIIRGGFFFRNHVLFPSSPPPKVKQKNVSQLYIVWIKSTPVYDSVNLNNVQRRLRPDPLAAEYENETFLHQYIYELEFMAFPLTLAEPFFETKIAFFTS